MKKTGKRKNQPAAYRPPRRAMELFLLLSLVAAGLYYEPAGCAASLFLTGYILWCVQKRGALLLPKTATLPAVTVIWLCYGLTALWGVDRGMAWLGFVKFMPLPLFALAAAQMDRTQRRELLRLLPVTGAVMVPATWALGQIPALGTYFLVGGRLAGTFQYPNTFALFLLLGVIVLADRARWDVRRMLCLASLMAGIFLSGSRTTLALLLAAVIALGVMARERKTRLLLWGMLAALLAAAGLYAALTGDLSTVGRYLTASAGASTFLGRLLYFRDALPVILRHPFGLGYMGYFYAQGGFQTGVYSVANIHNELLQLLLDVGWLPTALALFAVVKSLLPGQNSRLGRMLVLAICAHSLFDFDLQFVALGFVLLLAMDLEREETTPFRAEGLMVTAGCAVVCLSLYFGAASGLYYAHAYEAAATLYPGYTGAWLQLLPQAADAAEMDRLADRVLKQNRSAALAYDAKARAAYADGDIQAMIEYKQQAIALAKYALEEYLDYFDMLAVGVQLYEQAGDRASADYCRACLRSIPDMLARTLEDTSPLAWRIDDKPSLTLPEPYRQRLEALTM